MLINPQEFIIEIPKYSPISRDYKLFWSEQIDLCQTGKWISGYWMPPNLYFYVNISKILLNKKNSNTKTLARPTLRDLELEFFYSWTLARGFSGFQLDDTYSCNKILLTDYSTEYIKEDQPAAISSTGEKKIYVDPHEYIRRQHSSNLGNPLYHNQASNLLVLGSRDTGKSYMVANGICLHQFLFDGAEYRLDKEDDDEVTPIEITVGAELTHYTKLLLSKFKLALDNLEPGPTTFNDRRYPPPMSKRYSGSLAPGGQIVHSYDVYTSGGKETKGSQSTIKHRAFKDNSFADQGARNTAIIVEEAGMTSNLEDIYFNTKDNLRDGLWKTGTLLMLGTGGDMEAGTLDAAKMFYAPDEYEILSFNDTFENKGKIGFFIPAQMSLNRFKDERGFTRWEDATKFLNESRNKLKNSKLGSDAYNKEMQYRPMRPSEMFLTRTSSIFPTAEFLNRKAEVERLHLYEMYEKKIELFFNAQSTFNGISYAINDDLIPIKHFPHKGDNREGCIVMYHEPVLIDGKVPPNSYVIGVDHYKDDSQTGGSLAAVYVLKNKNNMSTMGHDLIVASYIGRPYMGKNAVNEIIYKLSLFYGNAKIYFENTAGNTKDYFEKIKRLDLLALQPTTIFNKKAHYMTGEPLVYGYPMSNDKVKWEAIQYLRSWFLEVREATDERTIRNLDMIVDIGLLEEALSYNLNGNFDRISGLMGAILGLEEEHNKSRYREQTPQMSQLEQEINKFLTNNKSLFHDKSITTSFF